MIDSCSQVVLCKAQQPGGEAQLQLLLGVLVDKRMTYASWATELVWYERIAATAGQNTFQAQNNYARACRRRTQYLRSLRCHFARRAAACWNPRRIVVPGPTNRNDGMCCSTTNRQLRDTKNLLSKYSAPVLLREACCQAVFKH